MSWNFHGDSEAAGHSLSPDPHRGHKWHLGSHRLSESPPLSVQQVPWRQPAEDRIHTLPRLSAPSHPIPKHRWLAEGMRKQGSPHDCIPGTGIGWKGAGAQSSQEFPSTFSPSCTHSQQLPLRSLLPLGHFLSSYQHIPGLSHSVPRPLLHLPTPIPFLPPFRQHPSPSTPSV